MCSETDEDIAKYSILHGNEQLFASKYKLYLPTEGEVQGVNRNYSLHLEEESEMDFSLPTYINEIEI